LLVFTLTKKEKVTRIQDMKVLPRGDFIWTGEHNRYPKFVCEVTKYRVQSILKF